MENKWIRAAIPALLIHCSIGTVYCWSTFKEVIANQIGASTFATGWAFSLAIFFLGMSAAFGGKFVEKDIHKSSLISCICFVTGFIGTGLVIKFCTGPLAVILIYLFYGCIMGIGLGIGYLTPVKTLMLWFSENKGLATGISIMGFGLAKAIATPIMEFLQNRYGITAMFTVLGLVYLVMMYTGHILLKKPADWVEPTDDKDYNFDIKALLKERKYTLVKIWIIFYINIHCGLMLITYEKQLLNTFYSGLEILTVLVSVVPSITAICNALGRIGYSTLSDKFEYRIDIYKIIFISCIGASAIACLICNEFSWIIIPLLMIVNLGYGGGFSTLPALLSSYFGMENISKIHGLVLSAWAIAGLTGNNMTELMLSHNCTYTQVIGAAGLLYFVAYWITKNIYTINKYA